MKARNSRIVSPSRFLGRVIDAQMDSAPVRHNSRTPSVVKAAHPFEAGTAVSAGPSISTVLGVGSEPQISPAIIRSIQILVVNLNSRPFPCHYEPSETRCFVKRPADPDRQVSFYDRAGKRSYLTPHRPFDLPPEHARLRIVIKDRADVLRRQIIAWLCHGGDFITEAAA